MANRRLGAGKSCVLARELLAGGASATVHLTWEQVVQLDELRGFLRLATIPEVIEHLVGWNLREVYSALHLDRENR